VIFQRRPLFACAWQFVLGCALISTLSCHQATASPEVEAASLCQKAVVLMTKNKFREALKLFDSVVRIEPNNPAGYLGRGSALAKLEENEGALKDLNKAIALDPNFAEAYCERGHFYGDIGNSKAAVADLEKSIALSRGKAGWSVYYDLGLLHDIKGESVKAVKDFTETIRRNPDLLWGYYSRAGVYYKMGRFQDAIADLNRCTKMHSSAETIKVYSLRADCYDKTGKHDLAMKDRKLSESYVKGGWADSLLESPATTNGAKIGK
jgi:tetratricopeptide (TPR) repeat protein